MLSSVTRTVFPVRARFLLVCLFLVGCSSGVSTPTAPPVAPDVRTPSVMEDLRSYVPPEVPAEVDGSTVVFAALGDSVSSGVGAGALTECGRSDRSWVGVLAERAGGVFLNYACAGAGLEDLRTQIASLDPTVDVVGVTLLGNDAAAVGVVLACARGECDAEVRASVRAAEAAAPAAVEVLKDVGRERRIILLGYVPVFMPDVSCPGSVSAEKSSLLSGLEDRLRGLHRDIVRDLVSDGFRAELVLPPSGHGFCSSDTWMHDLSSPLALHPTRTGHERLAELIDPEF